MFLALVDVYGPVESQLTPLCVVEAENLSDALTQLKKMLKEYGFETEFECQTLRWQGLVFSIREIGTSSDHRLVTSIVRDVQARIFNRRRAGLAALNIDP